MPLSTLIKVIQDIMRKDVGVDGDAQRISQMVWLLFLKIFDDKEQEWKITIKGYKSPLQSRFQWSNWAANAEGMTGEELIDFVNNGLFPALKKLATTAGVSSHGKVVGSVFEDAYNYMKSGTLLRQVINTIQDDVDFNSSEDRHLFGGIYEKILGDLQSAGNAGEYYTPRAVTQFMVDVIDPKLGEKILDPACGTGGFLANTIEHLKKQVKTARDSEILQKSINGVEKKPLPHMLAMTNMMLHGINVPTNIRHDNTLSRPLKYYGPKDRVDCVITNPPFGGMEEDGIENNFPKKYQTRETADLFMALIMHLLKHDTGRAAVVLPDGFLFGEGVKTTIKRELLTEFNLHTIVRLPNGVFSPYTGIKTNILFFEKGTPTKQVWFFEHPYPEGYKSYSRSKPLTIQEFDLEKKWWNKRKQNEYAWKVSVQEIEDKNYNLDFKNPHVVDVEHGDPDELMKEYEAITKKLIATRDALKKELMQALGGSR
ncbi:MAG: DNA methyltransferase [Peptococcaceae bacterium BRH_c4b]|nr:MAG: DNA methyltransferase [Peptococcaceae bacterium BRH_c4b]